MKDPKRMLSSSGSATGFERLLLDSVRREQPSASLRRRMQHGLGIATSIFGVKAALAAAGQIAVVALLATGISDSTKRVMPPSAQGSSISAPAVTAPTSVAATGSGAPLLERAETRAEAPRVDAPVAPAPVARPEPLAAVPALRDEIRLLDRARAALKQNAPKRALLELARYQERFPRGSFRQEASVLRVEALAQSGQRKRASALAREFVAQHPNSPHVDRVEQVTSAQRRAGVDPR